MTLFTLGKVSHVRVLSTSAETRMCFRFIALITLMLLATVPLFANSTRIVRRWVLTGLPMPQVKKILVIAVVENYLIRQQFEDEMERLLAKAAVQGIKSHMVLPPRNELMEGELKQRIKESDLDAVLAIRPKAVRKETNEVITSGVLGHVHMTSATTKVRIGLASVPRDLSPKPISSLCQDREYSLSVSFHESKKTRGH